MSTINKSALVMHSPLQMYTIVADIEAYPSFLQWCSSTSILHQHSSDQSNEVIARVDICYKGIEQSFTTRNTNVEADSIQMELAEEKSSFEFLQGCWLFKPIDLPEGLGCKVQFDLEFSMKNKIASSIFKTVFSQIINSQVDGFVKRAKELYG